MENVWTILRVVVAFGVVIALMMVLQRKTRKWTSRSRVKNLVQVRARQALGNKSTLLVIDISNRRYIVGVGDGNVAVIDKMRVPADDGFAEELAKAEQTADADVTPPSPGTPGLPPGQRPTFWTAVKVSAAKSWGMKL